MFGPGSATWRINGEVALMLGGGRALLMQLAHPAVAAGVADHSDFRRSPFERLWRTMEAMLAIEFGDAEQSRAAVAQVTGVHEGVRGTMPGGEPYDALDPELLMWVHATLVDSGLLSCELFVGSLPEAEGERYYEELKRQAVALRVPEAIIPETLAEFSAYVERMTAELQVSDQARAMRDELLSPRAPLAIRPLFAWQRAITVATLPPRIREGYRLECTPGQLRALTISSAALRKLVPLLPARLRRWPHALQAERRLERR